MFVYNQTGRLTFNGNQYWAYSGFSDGKNNHAMENIADIGPIPCGDWEIIRWDDHHAEKGPQVAVLRPVGHNAFGRTAFLIHGDSIENPGKASHGCIITLRTTRDLLRASGIRQLKVINGEGAIVS